MSERPFEAPHVSERFEIREEIGRGGMGVVYEAFDRELGIDVALKTLREFEPQNLYRFKQEFRALAEVEHPNLARLGELHCEHGWWFFSMELLSRLDFLSYVAAEGAGPGRVAVADSSAVTLAMAPGARDLQKSERGPTITDASVEEAEAGPPDFPAAAELFDEARLRAALAQLVRGLEALHRRGWVHLDVKPSNVLVDQDRVVIADFGLVRAFGERRNSEQDWDAGERRHVAGTLAYIAPEQLETEEMGPAADWYAVGVMLYQALTRRSPFTGTFSQVMSAKRDIGALRPSALVTGVPRDLERLCLDLLQPDPAKRPTGAEVLERVVGTSAGKTAGESIAESRRRSSPAFVGRVEELERLALALESSRKGASEAVLVCGEPGVGKTALVERFISERRDVDSLTVFRGRCYQKESVPFKAFDRVVDQLTRYLTHVEPGTAPEAEIRLAATLFPVLHHISWLEQSASATSIEVTEQQRQTAFLGLKRIFARLASKLNLLIFVDDLQWADDDSLSLLELFLQPPDAPSCLFVATMRTGAASSSSALLSRVSQRFQTIEIGGLSLSESSAVLAQLCGGASETALATLAVESGGHPLFLQQLAHFADSRDDASAGLRLEDAIRRRVSALQATERALVEALAVAGAPVPFAALCETTGVSLPACALGVRTLSNENLAYAYQRKGVRMAAPYHDRVREAVSQHLDAERSQSLELALGRSLARQLDEPDPGPGLLFRAVDHLNAARQLLDGLDDLQRLRDLNLRAGRASLATASYDAAAGYLEVAQASLPANAWQSSYELQLALARDLMVCNYQSVDQSAALSRRGTLLRNAVGAIDRADVMTLWASLESGKRYCYRALESGRRALEILGRPLPSRVTLAHLLVEHAKVRWEQGRRPLESFARLPRLDDPHRLAEVEALMTMTAPAFFVDEKLLALICTRLTLITLRHGLFPASAYGLAGYGMVLSGAFERHDEARRFGELALTINRRFEGHRFDAKVTLLTGNFITSWVRPYDVAMGQVEQARQDGLAHGDPEFVAYATVSASLFGFLRGGPLAEAEALARSQLETAHTIGDRDAILAIEALLRCYTTLQHGTLEGRAAGLPNGAIADDRFLELLSDEATPAALFWFLVLKAWVHFLHGEWESAERMLKEAAPRKSRTFGFPLLVDLTLLELLVEARRPAIGGSLDQARRIVKCRWLWRKLAGWARWCEHNFSAHERIGLAECARLERRPSAAQRLWEQAVEQAQRAGSPRRVALALALALEPQPDPDAVGNARAATIAWGAHALARRRFRDATAARDE